MYEDIDPDLVARMERQRAIRRVIRPLFWLLVVIAIASLVTIFR